MRWPAAVSPRLRFEPVRSALCLGLLSLAACSRGRRDVDHTESPSSARAAASVAPSTSTATSATAASAAPGTSASPDVSAAWALVRAACPSGLFVSQPVPGEYGSEGQATYDYARFLENGTVLLVPFSESEAGEDRKTMNERAAKWLATEDSAFSRGTYRLVDGVIRAQVTIAMSHAADPIEELAAHLDKPPYVFLSHSHATGHRSSLKYACVP